MIMQRYVPARGNKNSIVRLLWQRAPDEKQVAGAANMGGSFKMFSVSANKQYDGMVTQEKYTPTKRPPGDALRYLGSQLTERSPSEHKKEPEVVLNTKYMHQLSEKYSEPQTD